MTNSNTTRPGVLVLMGGPDAEREVSLMSGAAVAQALRVTDRFRVVEQTIDRISAEELTEVAARDSIDVVFPVLHGTWGEGGPLQEVIEEAQLAYVGSRPAAAALAMHKLATKSVVTSRGVQTPHAVIVNRDDERTLDPPIVLKPVDDGSSVDLRICRTESEIALARKLLHPKRGELLAERYVLGRELTVGIVTGEVLPTIEIEPGAGLDFYDYQAKYLRNDTQYIIDPDLPDGVADRLTKWSMLAYELTQSRDLARVDFMLDGTSLWFLEINTMPGFTSHSLVPMAARSVGLELPDLCTKLVMTALDRGPSPNLERAAPELAAR